MGTPHFGVRVLEALLRSSYAVPAVYSREPRPAGRGRKLHESPVAEAASQAGLPTVYPESLASWRAQADLAAYQPDVVVVAAYGRILPRQILSVPPGGCLNVHPSLLPFHRGPSPVASAILSGDRVTGVSIMLMDEGMDTGAVLAQEQAVIGLQETCGELTARLSILGADLLIWTLGRWLAGGLRGVEQDHSRSTYSRAIRGTDAELDWLLSAEELWRRVRAYAPWPGCYTWWQGTRLKVLEASPLAVTLAERPGTVVVLNGSLKGNVGVATGRGVLELRRVQLEGKRPLTVGEFVRGQSEFVGSVLRRTGDGG